jgi:hypothetical protein
MHGLGEILRAVRSVTQALLPLRGFERLARAGSPSRQLLHGLIFYLE